MDNLTHTLTGLVLARAGLSRASRGAAAALVVSSNLPDVDLVAALWGTPAYLAHHRGITHSVVGAPLLALALAGVLRVLFRGSSFLGLLAVSLIGVAGHVFMDTWTSYGTRILEPFDGTWYTLNLVFSVDPAILLLLLATLFLCGRVVPPSRVATLGLGLLAAYVSGCALLHERALGEAIARVPSATRVTAIPMPWNPFQWRVLADTGGAYVTGELNLLGRGTPLRTRPKRPETPEVLWVRERSSVASVFLDFSPFPWLEVEERPEGTEVSWSDLRFEWTGHTSFETRVLVARDGRILSETFRY